jgi:hypothetical protein
MEGENDQAEEDMGGDMAGDDRPRRGRRDRARRGGPPTYDVLAHVRGVGLRDAEGIVDYFTGALLAVPAPDAMRKTLLTHLRGDRGEFRLEDRDAAERLHGLLRLIVSTPEFQLS